MLERFDRYMERCLYDPVAGFYSTGAGAAGRRGGDFITSPEVGPLFADVLANALDHWWELLGQPATFEVYDAGTGPGTLARALTAAPGSNASARTVIGVDRSPDGSTELPADLTGAVVIANELLDNLPFRIMERSRDGWLEVWVQSDPDRGPIEVLEPVAGDLPAILTGDPIASVRAGGRVPILDEATRWVEDVLARTPAVLLVFDYGAATTAQLAERGAWLRTYRSHQRSDDPYRDPGEWDITTDVAVDQLPSPSEVTEQRTFLRRWGIERLVGEGRDYWKAHAAAPDLAAFRMRSRVVEAEALLDPAALGSWLVCSWMSTTVG